MANWDDSDSSDDDPKKTTKTVEPKKKPKPVTNWDDSTDDDDTNNDNNNKTSNNNATKTDIKPKATNIINDSSSEEETPKQNASPKQGIKAKPKPKAKPKRQRRPKKGGKKKIVLNDDNLFDSKPKSKKQDKNKRNNDNDSSSDSTTSSDDNNGTRQDGVKRDFQTENDALFNGIKDGKVNKNNNESKKDERPMLSGNVKLTEYPIGSSHDIRNLTHEISGILQQKIFENVIRGDDIFIFFESLLNDHKLTESMDMVDAKNIVQLANKILKVKQKQFRAAKQTKSISIYYIIIIYYK